MTNHLGGIPERLNVEDYLRKPGNGPEKLHHLLEVSHKKGALISCTLGGSHAMEAVNQKLQQRHAYTVIGMTKVGYSRFHRRFCHGLQCAGSRWKKWKACDPSDEVERSTRSWNQVDLRCDVAGVQISF